MPTINNISNSYYKNVRTQEQKDQLGKDDFLKILITQLSHQDPMKPMEDKEFIGQMAQFSTLEQIVNLNQTFTKFASTQNGLSTYATSIGKEIRWIDPTTDLYQNGTVTGVLTKNSQIYYMVDGKEISVDQVESIRQPQD